MRPEDSIREAIADQAAEWLTRQRAENLAPEARLELMEWLRTSPHHVHEYLEQVSMLQLLPDALGGLPASDLPNQAPPAADNVVSFGKRAVQERRTARAGGARFKKLAGAAAAVLTVIGLSWGALALREAATIRVAHGDQRTLRLDDGSMVILNSQAKASIHYTSAERRILLDGQALFSVAKDASRPFRVMAGDTEVVAVGTQFEVYRRSHGTTVTVIEGRVDVLDRRQMVREGEANGAISASTSIRVDAGEQLKLGPALDQPKSVHADVQVATAWVRREIVSHRRPLAEVAEEFNRYLAKPVLIEDAVLRETQINGTFSAYSPETFFAFLREFKGVVTEERSDAVHVRVMSKDPAPTYRQ